MKNLLVILSFLFSINSFSQDVISFEKVKSYTIQQLKSINPLVQAKYDIDVYSIEYTTKKINQEIDTASGLVAIPLDTNLKYPVMVYEHGTAGDRNGVPSRDAGNKLLSAIMATYGYVCIMPDYIGLGISKGLHPYLHPESEAWATVDLLKATKTLVEDSLFEINDQLFITGYSQGGHSAMATSRFLNTDESFEVTASAPMSGPYSVSKEMKDFTLAENEYSFCGYLGSVFLSAKFTNPDLLENYDVENVFKEDYATLIRMFEEEEISLWTMNSSMITLLKADGGKVIPKRMFTDSIQNGIINNPNHPINLALKRMDVVDWIPEFPLRMIYCTADNQVTYRNAVYTDSLMNAKGAENVTSKDVFSSGDHSTCFNFALIDMISFFGNYQKIETVGIDEIGKEEAYFWPNPNNGKLWIYLPNDNSNEFKIIIRDIRGVVVLRQSISNINNEIDISTIKKGLIFIQLLKDNDIIVNRKMILTF